MVLVGYAAAAFSSGAWRRWAIRCLTSAIMASRFSGWPLSPWPSSQAPIGPSSGRAGRLPAWSSSRLGGCDCEAGLLGQPCKHRAAVAIRLYERETGARVVAIKAGAALAMERYLRAG